MLANSDHVRSGAQACPVANISLTLQGKESSEERTGSVELESRLVTSAILTQVKLVFKPQALTQGMRTDAILREIRQTHFG